MLVLRLDLAVDVREDGAEEPPLLILVLEHVHRLVQALEAGRRLGLVVLVRVHQQR